MNAHETIKVLFKEYSSKYWTGKDNEQIVDSFYGNFLVDLEHELKKRFPEVIPFIQIVTPPQ